MFNRRQNANGNSNQDRDERGNDRKFKRDRQRVNDPTKDSLIFVEERIAQVTLYKPQEPATKLNLELTALVGEGETNTLLSNFSGAGADLESLGPLMGLARVKDGRLSREDYIERYGHRGPHEVELYFPASSDDPD